MVKQPYMGSFDVSYRVQLTKEPGVSRVKKPNTKRDAISVPLPGAERTDELARVPANYGFDFRVPTFTAVRVPFT